MKNLGRRARGKRPATATLPYRCTCHQVHAVTAKRTQHAPELSGTCPRDKKTRRMRRIHVRLERLSINGEVEYEPR